MERRPTADILDDLAAEDCGRLGLEDRLRDRMAVLKDELAVLHILDRVLFWSPGPEGLTVEHRAAVGEVRAQHEAEEAFAFMGITASRRRGPS